MIMNIIFFTNRVLNAWNSLTNYIVNSDTTHQFKSKLDKLLSNQAIILSYKLKYS